MIYLFVFVPALIILSTTIITYSVVGFRIGILLRNILITGLVCGVVAVSSAYVITSSHPETMAAFEDAEAPKPSKFVDNVTKKANNSYENRKTKNNKKWSGDFWERVSK